MGEEEPLLPCPFPPFAPLFPPAVVSASSVLLLMLSPFFVPPFPAVSLAVSAGRRRNRKLVVWQTLGGGRRKGESRR